MGILTFCKVAEMRLKTYRHTHGRTMATPAVAQMTATMLYGKRFFPYYISNILAGVDKAPMSVEKAINIIHDVFISAAEREIHTGDGISLKVITKDGIKCQELPLRRD